MYCRLFTLLNLHMQYSTVSTCRWNKQYITDFVFYQPPSSVRLSSLPSYYIPRDGPQPSYQDFISMLPPTEHPEVFGQHFNADIASQIAEARMLFDTLLSLRPQVTGPTAAGAGPSREDKVRGRGSRLVEWKHLTSWDEMRPTILYLNQSWAEYWAIQ